MATTSKVYLNEVNAILKDVKASLQSVLGDESIAKNTRHTKAYNLRKEIKRLVVIAGLLNALEESKVKAIMDGDKNFKESLLSIINPEDGGTKVVVKEGDNLITLMSTTYADVRDIYARVNKAAEAAGLVLNDKNVFVKKA